MDLNQNLKSVEKVNAKLLVFFDNPFVKYGFLIFVVLRIIFISDMEDYYINLFNYPIVKIIYALLIAYSACFDPIYAVALTTLIIICIQELYSRNATKAIIQVSASAHSKPFISSTSTGSNKSSSNRSSSTGSVLLDSSNAKVLVLPTSAQMTPQQVTTDSMPDNSILVNDANVYNLINKHTLQRIPAPNDTLIAEYDYYEDPAYKTLTSNIQETGNSSNSKDVQFQNKNYLGHNKFYVTDDNLANIQTNQEPNSDQNVSVQAFPKVMNIQGLPNGFDSGICGGNPKLASIISN